MSNWNFEGRVAADEIFAISLRQHWTDLDPLLTTLRV